MQRGLAVPFNPNKEGDTFKLREAIEYGRERLRLFRENRKDFIDQYAGGSYGDGGESGEVILPMMELAVNIYQRMLASHTPQVLVDSPMARTLMPVAYELSIAMNHLVTHEMDFGDALNDVVYDALFTMGIMKVGVTPSEHDGYGGHQHDAGQPFADPIGFEDWVHDANAKRWEQIEFCGNQYILPYEQVMESPLFTKKGKRELIPYLRNDAVGGGSLRSANWEDPSYLSQGGHPMPVELNKHIRLWDIWLPGEQLLVTLHADGTGPPLRVVDWDGPDRWGGPYHIVGFSKVPGNLIPLAPTMIWSDLADLLTRLASKAAAQADRQKTVLAGQNRTKSAMEAIIDTPDGQSLCLDVDPNMVKEFVFGGVDGNLMGAMSQFRDLFTYVAGNLDALGGLAAMSGTLGQDRLLSAGASQRLSDMQDRVVKFTTGVVEDLAWYLWRDPLIELPLTKQITPSISRDFTWNSDSREGEFFHYNFKVVPHSLQSRSPQERLQLMLQLVNTIVIPMMPMLQQQGILFDVKAFLEQVAKLSNSPELEKILVVDTGQSLSGQGAPIDPRQSPVTTRNYTRTDRGGGGQQGPGTPQNGNQPGQQPHYQQGQSRGSYRQNNVAAAG